MAKRKQSKTDSSSAIVTQHPATVCTASQQLVDQRGRGVTCLTTTNQGLQQCTISQLEDQHPRIQEATANQQAVMVQQFHQHSTVTTSPTSILCSPVSVNSSVQLTGHIHSSSVSVSSHAAISTIQDRHSFPQSNIIQNSSSSCVLPVTVTGNSNVIIISIT